MPFLFLVLFQSLSQIQSVGHAQSPMSVTCTPASLNGSGVQNTYQTPLGVMLTKKTFIQKMNHECTLEWEVADLDLQVPAADIPVQILDYNPEQIEDIYLPQGTHSRAHMYIKSETPQGERWRFRLRSQVKVVSTPTYFDFISEAATGTALTSIQPLPGGSPGSDRVRYLQIRVRGDRLNSRKLSLKFETLSAVDISGFAAGFAFKMFGGGANDGVLKKFDEGTLKEARAIGERLKKPTKS